MASPSVTYSFTNGTTIDAGEVNSNFTDIINALTDGSKSLGIDALTVAGAGTFNGNNTFGNSSSDDLTITASLASSIPIKTTATYNIGDSTHGLAGIYFGGNSQTTRIISSGSATGTYTITLPVAVGSADQALVNTGSGVTAWRGVATSSAVGLLERVTRWQIKYLTATVSATTNPMSDLTFNALTIGRTYRITMNFYGAVTGTSGTESVDIYAVHDSADIAFWTFRSDAGPADTRGQKASIVHIFTATTTTLTFRVEESGTMTVVGSGSGVVRTNVILEELGSYEETTAFT